MVSIRLSTLPFLQNATSAFVEAKVISSNGAVHNSSRSTNTGYPSMASYANMYTEERLFDFDDLSSDDEETEVLGSDYEWAVEELAATLQLSDEARQVTELVQNMKSMTPATRLQPMQLAQALSTVFGEHKAFVRSAAGSSSTKNCLSNLKHTYVVISSSQHAAGLELVVEPYFSESFELGRTTARYAKFHQHMPEVFVGTRVTLARAVKIAAREIEIACQTLEQPIPPWRKYSALMSKWALDRREDTSLSSVDSIPLSFASTSSDGVVLAPNAPAKTIYGFDMPGQPQWSAIKAHVPRYPSNMVTSAIAPQVATDLDALFGKIQKVKLRYDTDL